MNGAHQPASRSYHDFLIESLKPAAESAAYLEVSLEEGDPDQILLALKHVAEAKIAIDPGFLVQGNWGQGGLDQGNLDNLLTPQDLAGVDRLIELLDAFGLQLRVIAKEPSSTNTVEDTSILDREKLVS
ncbi:MAG: transcriptional regulator [Cyanobacteria bacterium CRU_2_1]|nr:transcriptional regulator [Cyanobacteria bacterium RU_5_0]NJR63896.1 transcriptional regulator [Cyanobacteria bacterium CRU_2_1]